MRVIQPVWVVIAALLVALLVPTLARAAKPYGVVTVDLRPEIGEVPTHLCVVSQGQGPRTRQRLSELFLPHAGTELAQRDELILDPATWGSGSDERPCEAGGACLPRVELPIANVLADDLWVACTSDSLVADRSTRDPRVLVMMLEHLEGSPPLLESLKLTGGVATIGVQADLSRIVVTARSLGGHYDAHTRAFRAEEASDHSELVALPLAPRCHGVEIELPGVRLRESDRDRLELRAHGVDLDVHTCVGPLQGSARMHVELPRAEGFGRLEVELPPTAGETPTATRFAASWGTAWPEGELRLDPHQLAFIWAPPACVWAIGTCPAATLEGGLSCEATPLADGTCQYLCPAGGDASEGDEEWVDVSPPVAVTFQKTDPDQRWNELLQRPGQVLSSYVDSEHIYLGAALDGWSRSVPGSRISHVELLENDGSSRKYAVADVDELRILAAGASCDPLRYRLVGDRRYQEGAAEIRDGQVEFGQVHKTARLLTFNVTIAQGGGIALMSAAAPDDLGRQVYFTAIGQLAANFRPRDPRYARVAYELRLGGTLGQWGYYGPGSLGEPKRQLAAKLAWARLLFEPAVIVDVVPPLSLSLGVGIGGSWPINNGDVINTGRFNWIISPSLDARVALRRWVSLVVQGRVMLREQTSVAVDIAGSEPVFAQFSNVSLIGLYGAQFSF
ncbi:hypothetical protein [Enhygromyxa salina]|uniref:Uncharacterized protein n=1 Tax=Enhygromyxa salina TaxID=215803 RepID=A0A2S9XV45_9BACT|nr:hypothetical protein [Enhygromyxa salina]PRP96739.1 hypothetical protein ENSA7_68090 [Enhygromyxa salina]